MKTINTGINTDSFITGYSRFGRRPVRHLRIEDDSTFVKIYSVGTMIGKGTFGTVFEVRDTKDSKKWASKVIEKKSVAIANMKVLEREINILKVLNHPHIIVLREVLESATKIYLIMEKCLTDLLKLTKDNTYTFNEDNVRRVILDLTSAITYLHKNDIVHRDVKLENILVTDNPDNADDHLYIKLSDFGLSIIKSGHGITNMSMLHERCGTLQYMSPEIVSSKAYSQQCDVWSIGVITYYMLTNLMPFHGKRESELIMKIIKEEPQLTTYNFSVELKDMFRRVLNKDPAARITAAELMNHAWLRGQRLIDNTQSHNVIDLMRLCNKDMRVSTIEDELTPADDPLLGQDNNHRSQATVAVKNVTFDKKANHPRTGKKSVSNGASNRNSGGATAIDASKAGSFQSEGSETSEGERVRAEKHSRPSTRGGTNRI